MLIEIELTPKYKSFNWQFDSLPFTIEHVNCTHTIRCIPIYSNSISV